MVAEEIGLNDFLERHGVTPVETDLGEYIIQLRHEIPSHIIAPAVHLTKAQVESDFRRVHTHLPPRPQSSSNPPACWRKPAAVLREKVLAADVGVYKARTSSSPRPAPPVIVTNEGNGDLTQTLPKAHIVLASLEKLVPTLEEISPACCALLARSGDRPGNVGLHHALDRPPPAPGDPHGPGEFTWCCSTTGAPRCWPASSSTCCAASAAAPA